MRSIISDFAVMIAIVLMVLIDALIGLKTPKLEVPEKFEPTNKDNRGWFIPPFHPKNPWWICIAAIVPALLGTILIFMDQQITAVIVNRKENKLKVGLKLVEFFLAHLSTKFSMCSIGISNCRAPLVTFHQCFALN